MAIAAAKCANAEFSPEKMRLCMREFQYQGCDCELKGISDYKQTDLHLHSFICLCSVPNETCAGSGPKKSRTAQIHKQSLRS